MRPHSHRTLRPLRAFAFALLLGVGWPTHAQAADQGRWVTAWATAPLAEIPGKDTPALDQATLRQVVRVTVAGSGFRLRLENYFGAEPLKIGGARVAVAESAAAGAPMAWRPLRFSGRATVSVPPGGAVASDAIDAPVAALAQLVVEMYIAEIPKTLTGHSAARATSFVAPGNALPTAAGVPATHGFTRWYFLGGVDVLNDSARAVAVLGDSIADGYGCPPDSYTRWPDALADRLQRDSATRRLAVLNLGIGGNRLLRDGLGPRALSRVDRDVFGQSGVTTVVVCLGINDIGTRLEARKRHQSYASAQDIIEALRQLAERSRRHGLKVIGCTLTPYRGADFYWSEDGDADRQTVNDWIRHGRAFDAVIDFDAALRDPVHPDRLAARFSSGDHLHPSVAGYAEMARVIDVAVLAVPAATTAGAR